MAETTTGGAQQTDNPVATPSTETKGDEKVFTQSDLDKAITKAIETREKNLKTQWEAEQAEQQKKSEQEKLEADHKYKELYETIRKEQQAKELRESTVAMLKDKDMLAFMDAFNNDLSGIDGRKALIETFSDTLKAEVDKRVNEALKTPAPAQTTNTTTNKPINKMSFDEYKEYRKTIGIS